MPFIWSQQRIQWYLDASRNSGFHAQLARLLSPLLRPEDTVCDMGCGLGRLDLELAPLVSHITCLDIDRSVISTLRQDARRAGIHNLSALCRDAREEAGQFDVVLAAFFGTTPQTMLDHLRRARRMAVSIMNLHGKAPSPSMQRHYDKKGSAEAVADALAQSGYSCRLLRHSLSFDQPLKSDADALAFLRCCYPELSAEELHRLADRQIVRTDSAEFPLSFPKRKDLAILAAWQ